MAQDSQSSYRIDQRLVKAANEAPLLDKEREFELARRWRKDRDSDALSVLLGAYLRLVISMASKWVACSANSIRF